MIVSEARFDRDNNLQSNTFKGDPVMDRRADPSADPDTLNGMGFFNEWRLGK